MQKCKSGPPSSHVNATVRPYKYAGICTQVQTSKSEIERESQAYKLYEAFTTRFLESHLDTSWSEELSKANLTSR